MTQTVQNQDGKWQCIDSYVNMTKVGEQLRKQKKTRKQVYDWGSQSRGKTHMEHVQKCENVIKLQIRESADLSIQPLKLTIEGGQQDNVRGTYFHPDLAIHVMKWLVPDEYDSKAHELIYQSIIDENTPVIAIPTPAEFMNSIGLYSPQQQKQLIVDNLKELKQKHVQYFNMYRDEYDEIKDRITEQIEQQMIEQLQNQQNELLQQRNESEQIKQQNDEKDLQIQQLEKQVTIYGQVYEIGINPSVRSLIDQQHLRLFDAISPYIKYIGQANRSGSTKPAEQRCKDHMNELRALESSNSVVQKAIILTAFKLLINKCIKTSTDQLEYEQIYQTTVIADKITKKSQLNKTEAQLINQRNPTLNTIRYTNYESDEIKEINDINKQLKKKELEIQRLQQDIQKLEEKSIISKPRYHSQIQQNINNSLERIVQLNRECDQLKGRKGVIANQIHTVEEVKDDQSCIQSVRCNSPIPKREESNAIVIVNINKMKTCPKCGIEKKTLTNHIDSIPCKKLQQTTKLN